MAGIHRRTVQKIIHNPDNDDGEITHLEPDILECEVRWALGSITTNKASGGDGIPVDLFQIIKDDAVKVLHLICQKIWKTQQWPQDWDFHSNPKESKCQRRLKLPHNCTHLILVSSMRCTHLIPASKVMLKFSKPGFSNTWTGNF